MAPGSTQLFSLAASYLARQGWYLAATESLPPGRLELVRLEVLSDASPGLARLLVARPGRAFQLLVGWRPAREVSAVLKNEQSALLGAAEDGGEQVIVYEALADDDLARAILSVATAGRAQSVRVRLVSSLVSHASLVFDERLFMKCYRVLEEGVRPEVEVLFALDEIGFNALLAPVGRWSDDGYDLAIVREFLPSALEGRLLALTSLRDLLAHAARDDEESNQFNQTADPTDADAATASAGGDFASEMARLGETTARLHLALRRAFGDHRVDPGPIARRVAEAGGDMTLGEAGDPSPRRFTARDIAAGIEALDPTALGCAIRLHGDYHLRRVMRCETGWIVAGFSDDPLYATGHHDPSLPPRTGSPLEDLADMSFALGQVAREALGARPQGEEWLAAGLAEAWKRRNKAAFLRGYRQTPGAGELLAADESTCALLLAGFELIRERRYEATSAFG